MATNVNTLIRQIEQEFNTLSTARQHIDTLKDASETVIMGINLIQEDIGNYLDSYQNLTSDIKNLEKEVSSIDFPMRFLNLDKRLKTSVTNIEKQNKKIIEDSKSLVSYIKNLKIDASLQSLRRSVENERKSIEVLQEKITNLDNNIKNLRLPLKFNTLENTISGINTSTQNILSQIQHLERNLKDDSSHKTDLLKQEISVITNKNKQLMIMLIVIIILNIGLGGLIFLVN